MKANILFPLVKRRCRRRTFFHLWLALGDLLVLLIQSLSGKSLQGLKNEFMNMRQRHERLLGRIKLVRWGKAFYLVKESLALNTYRMSVGCHHLLKFCLFFLKQLPTRHWTLSTLYNYLLDETEYIAYASLSSYRELYHINKSLLSTFDVNVQKHVK